MKILDDILWIEKLDFTGAGWKAAAVEKANYRNGQWWQMMPDPLDAKLKLVRYDTLRPEHKDNLRATYGDCWQYAQMQPLLGLVVPVLAAQEWLLAYRYTKGGQEVALSDEHYRAACKRADWLDMLVRVVADKKVLKKQFGIKGLPVFYTHIIALLQQQGVDLPTSYGKLKAKMVAYAAGVAGGSYEVCLPPRLGNASALKVADRAAEDALLRLIEHPNQYDDVLIALMYSKWAQANGYEPILPGAVGVWRRKFADKVTLGRYGNAAFNEKYVRQVKGIGPRAPLELAECDDYNFNYYYTGPDGSTDVHRRYVGYIVADSRYGLVLGASYSQANHPTVDMVKLAWIDAMHYIRRLTGGWHLPWEVKADGWQRKKLHPWLGQIAHMIPAGHGNKHRGYIEQLFGSPHFKRAEKLAAHNSLNYNGNNVGSAKQLGVNVDALKANEKQRPAIGDEAVTQIERMIALTRHMPWVTRKGGEGPSLEAQFVAAWEAQPAEARRAITHEQYLMQFGLSGDRPVSITNRGVETQINNQLWSYDLPDYAAMTGHIGKKVTVLYDPYDMSQVLCTDGAGLRFMAPLAQKHGRTLRSSTGSEQQGSRQRLNAVLDEKRRQVKAASDGLQQRQHKEHTDPELILLGGYMPKELKADVDDAAGMVVYGGGRYDKNYGEEPEEENWLQDY